MEFAKAQLSKYGWKEGKGLGKAETGITEAIKPKLKFNNSGIGYDGAEDFTYFWWQHAFDAVSKSIDISKKEDDVSLNVSQDLDISTKKVSSKKRKNLVFNNFLKSATTLTNKGLIRTVTEDDEDTTEVSENHVGVKDCPRTDEELFRACGGRTAHKGARHGFKLSGKLARVEEQERKLLSMISSGANPTMGCYQDEQKTEKMHTASTKDSSCVEEHIADVPVKHKKKKRTEKFGNIEEDVIIKKEKKRKKNKKLGLVDVSVESNEATENNIEQHKKMINDEVDFGQQSNNVMIDKPKKSKRKGNSEIEHCMGTLLEDSGEKSKRKKRETSDRDEVQGNIDTNKKKRKKRKNTVTDEIHGDCLALDDSLSKSSLVFDTDYVDVKKAKKSKRRTRNDVD